MSEDVKNCPLCGSPQSSPFDKRTFRGEQVANRICRACGLVYQSPRMTQEELADFYTRGYRELYQGSERPGSKDLLAQRKRAIALIHAVDGRLNRVTRHLDIGCSAGYLLERFLHRFACQPVGIEPGAAYREYAQREGFTVYASLVEMLAAGEERFDFISMAHVLEHLPEPVSYLASLRENVLTPDGRLLVEVPNLYAHDCFEVAHLVAYSPHTLVQTLQRAGFTPLFLRRHGQPRSKILPLYLTALAKPEAHPTTLPVKAEKIVALKRRLGLFRRRLLTRLLPRQAWLPLH